MTDVAGALLEAHVQHELERLGGAHLEAGIREGVEATFQWFETVSLNEVATREQILGLIDRYVIELRVSGGITELAGEMSNVVFSSPSASTTRIDEILSPEAYEDFADKIAALEGAQRELIHHVTRSAAFRALALRLVVRTLADLVVGAGDGLAPRWKALLGAAGRKIFPSFEARAGAVLSEYVEARADRFAQDARRSLREVIDVEWLRRVADEIWDEISAKPVGAAGQVLSAQDLEDFVVLGYEFWLKFRKTKYFRAVSTEVVDRLFEKYGDETVQSVILDMGVTAEMIARELNTFLSPFFERALLSGFLQRVLRERLEPFYRSAAVADILQRFEHR
jgi:hypothetical protein